MSDIFEILGPVVDITSHEIDELKHELKNKTQELYEM